MNFVLGMLQRVGALVRPTYSILFGKKIFHFHFYFYFKVLTIKHVHGESFDIVGHNII